MMKTLRLSGATEDEARERGFTLIELLVVVLIIGILVGIAIPIFLNQRQKAALASVQADVRNATTATETYNTTAGTNGVAFAAGSPGANITLSDGTQVAVSNNNTVSEAVTANGYCIKGTGQTGGKVVWYDSSTGSQIVGTSTKPTAAQAPNCNAQTTL